MIQTEGTGEEKYQKALNLMKSLKIGSARFVVPAKNASGL